MSTWQKTIKLGKYYITFHNKFQIVEWAEDHKYFPLIAVHYGVVDCWQKRLFFL